eukprot:TRINITY_DN3018_c0_g1_i2.p1 TRINITY_DN3018_c0_g1~~TRINITY_DN3018_c0_g1_i2.p1  ORF type:complete len:408 (+),score=66.43 TRINITY_DN3018_c0_g1_i2:1102-2325(+)
MQNDKEKTAVERMLERERVMKEKEEALRKAELEKERANKEAKQKHFEQLAENDRRRKELDSTLRGVYYSSYYNVDNTHIVINKPLESQEEEIPKLEKWIKTDNGWVCSNPNNLSAYEVPATYTFLPFSTLVKLDLPYGFQKTNSPDFDTACQLIEVLFTHYYSHGGETVKCLIQVVKNAVDYQIKIKMGGDSCGILSELIIKMWRVIDSVKKVEKASGVDMKSKAIEIMDKHQSTLVAWRKILVDIINLNKVPKYKFDSDSDLPPIQQIPYEIITSHILLLLDVPSLVCSSMVCHQWYTMANHDNLYKYLFNTYPWPSNLSSKKELISELTTYREKFIFCWLAKKSNVHKNGLYVCLHCNNFYWGGQNTSTSCRKHHSSFDYHIGKSITKEDVIRILVEWNPNRVVN